ncbi:MAG TPA: hypothetical protein VH105_08755 [Burkholderiales bacterium]|nr:hypothetical protein [Burkholderiales bacterium]
MPDAHSVLRAWLAADSYPPYTLDELTADPLRRRVAELIASRGDVDELQRLLGGLLGRPSPAAVDRMLLADALLSRGSFEQAHSALQDVTGEPGRIGARACAKLVSVIYYQGEFERAGALIKQAMQGAPEAMYCRIFMGTLTDYEGDAAAALQHYRRAVALRPASVDARVALAMGLLRCDDLQAGFAEWVIAEYLAGEYTRASSAAVWDGRPLRGERILLLTSNFYGDVMQMLRFARHLREREPAARMSIQIQAALAQLATDTGLFERVYVGNIAQDDFDWQVSLTHIPLHLETRIEDLRRFEPYLRVPAERIAEAAAWLPPRRPGRLRVGLRWYGRAQYHNFKRSVPFELLRPLFAVPGIDWIALTEDASMFAGLGEHPLADVSRHLSDFSSTGALMAHLDLTISVDTSIAHLAGALNLPFWLLAQPDPEWRWGRHETSSHWYGSARCFRHTKGFDWEAMVREMAVALADFAAGSQYREAPDPATPLLPPLPASMPARPASSGAQARVLREWLQRDTFPTHVPEELSADPLRAEVAALVAERGDADRLQHLLTELLARPDPPAVDRMLLAEAMLARGSFEQAHTLLLEVVDAPGRIGARACALLADALLARGEFAHASGYARRAVEGAPDSVSARLALGALLDYAGDPGAAVPHYRRATYARLALPDAHLVLATGLLRLGRLQEGLRAWVLAEQVAGEYRRESAAPVWDGRAMHQDRLLILSAYGYGDMLQMMRFARHLREREPRARLSIQLPAPLAALAGDTGLFEHVYVGKIEQDIFDWQVTMNHLPLLLGVEEADLRRFEPYLQVPRVRAGQAAAWLPARRPGRLRVGLRWRGQASHFDAKRSIPFAALQPLFSVPGVDWISLAEDPQALAGMGEHPLIDVSRHLTDFAATAALLTHLDLVISADTSVVHVAGGLGLPVWLLARPDPEWRWGSSGPTSPWYGSVRIFRHLQGFDWDAVVQAAALALAQHRALTAA